MPAKLTYGAALFLMGASLIEKTAAQENGHFKVKIGGKTDGRDTISASSNCNDNKVYLQSEDANGWVQDMELVKKQNGFNVIASGERASCNNKFLSVGKACFQNSIDWYSKDDNSGR